MAGSGISSLENGALLVQMSSANSDLMKSFQQILSYQSGPPAAIDPAGSIISTQMQSQIGELRQKIINTDNLIAKYNTGDAYAGELRRMTIDLRQLSIQAANEGGLDEASRQAIQTSADYIVDSYNSVLGQAEYNGMALLDGSEAAIANIPELSQIDLSSPEAIEASMAKLQAAAKKLDNVRMDLGSQIKHDLGSTRSSLHIALENISAAQAGIATDMMTALTHFIRAMRQISIDSALQAHGNLNKAAIYDLLKPPLV